MHYFAVIPILQNQWYQPRLVLSLKTNLDTIKLNMCKPTTNKLLVLVLNASTLIIFTKLQIISYLKLFSMNFFNVFRVFLISLVLSSSLYRPIPKLASALSGYRQYWTISKMEHLLWQHSQTGPIKTIASFTCCQPLPGSRLVTVLM